MILSIYADLDEDSAFNNVNYMEDCKVHLKWLL